MPLHAPACIQVSDGELRQPGPEIMRKLAGAKDKLSCVPCPAFFSCVLLPCLLAS